VKDQQSKDTEPEVPQPPTTEQAEAPATSEPKAEPDQQPEAPFDYNAVDYDSLIQAQFQKQKENMQQKNKISELKEKMKQRTLQAKAESTSSGDQKPTETKEAKPSADGANKPEPKEN
jgi:hypothetical protein